ncbi:hypothetical protein ASE26_12200 [Duganella sp. Root198D2]|nr:hypothetical protein ASE26_12200 [Duganella sp. Root198D2]
MFAMRNYLVFLWLLAAAAHASPPGNAYATIDWPNKLNPHFVPLGAGRFLVSTRSGKLVWDAEMNSFGEPAGWPLHTAIGGDWTPLGDGVLVEGRAHDDDGNPVRSLVWWNKKAATFSPPLVLPSASYPSALVPLDGDTVLACMGSPSHGTRAVLVSLRQGIPTIINEPAPALRQLLAAKGVTGPVDGIGQSDAGSAPVRFEIAFCGWQMRNPPQGLANGKQAVKPQYLPDGRIVIAAGEPAIDTPYIWDPQREQWEAFTSKPPVSARLVSGFAADDEVVALGGSSNKYADFLDPATLRWTRSQDVAAIDSPDPALAPLGKGRVLAFLREHGRVVLLQQLHRAKAGEFLYSHGAGADVLAPGGRLYLLDGGDPGQPINRPEAVGGEADGTPQAIAPLPLPLGSLSAVALPDGSLLAFGGRRTYREAMPAPAFRYDARQDRWEPAPGLEVGYAAGQLESTEGGALISEWPRGDFLLDRHGTLAVLDGADLLRWRPGAVARRIPLPRPHTAATLLETTDGRLLVVGGTTGTGAPNPVSDLFSPRSGRWQRGPKPHVAGGRAVRMADGSIFKVTLADARVRAEVAGAALARWKLLPPPPLQSFSLLQLVAVGRDVVLLPNNRSQLALVWSRQRGWRTWRIATEFAPTALVPAGGRRAVARDWNRYALVELPR